MNTEQPPLGYPVPGRRATIGTYSDLACDDEPTGNSPATPPLGSPIAAVKIIAPVSIENQRRLDEAKEQTRLEEEKAMEGRVFGGVPDIRVPAFLMNSTFLLLLGAVAGVVGLFVYSQALAVIGQIPHLPGWLQFASYSVLVVLLALVLAFGIRLAMVYSRLKTSRRIRLQGLEELRARADCRRLLGLQAREARDHLLAYLESYPINEKRLAALGFDGAQRADLAKYRTKLMAPGGDLGPTHWLVEFKNSYQLVLDQAADARISYHARRVALRTAVVPFALADTVVVIHSSFALIGDLCQIYNLRLGRMATLVVAGWAAIQSVLAGKFEDSAAVGRVNDEIVNATLGEHFHDFTGAAAGHVANIAGEGVGRLLGRRAMRAVEQAIIQRFLLKRLGKCTKGWLRMVE